MNKGAGKHKTLNVTIGPKQDGMRLDLALVALDLGLSRRKIRSVIDTGGCYLNRTRVRMNSKVVHQGDRVTLEFNEDPPSAAQKSRYEISDKDILHFEPSIVAVNKPPGVPSQATRDQAIHHMAIYLKQYLKKHKGIGKDPQPVHRLDKDTSGVMLFALDNQAMEWLTGQFRDKEVKKTYLAVCHGLSPQNRFEVSCYLSPIDKKTGHVQIVKSGGKESQTFFEVLATNNNLKLSLLRCQPITGRSHQIRVHLASRQLPIVGDKRYGHQRNSLPEHLKSLAAQHHFLHAAALTFYPGPKTNLLKLEAPLPAAMQEFMNGAGLADAKGT